MFVKFSNIEVKIALDNQPMLGTGLLPDWLCNLAQGMRQKWFHWILLTTCASGTALLFSQGARPDRSKRESLQRVTSNSVQCQSTSQELHLMSWIRSKDILIMNYSFQIGYASESMSLSARKTMRFYGISERILLTS